MFAVRVLDIVEIYIRVFQLFRYFIWGGHTHKETFGFTPGSHDLEVDCR